MKQLTLSCVLILITHCVLLAQTATFSSTELISADAKFQPTQIKYLGISSSDDPPQLVYQFTHPQGAIQKVMGSLMSGGKDPVNIPAYGKISLGESANTIEHSIQWVSPDGTGTSVNIFASPLTTPQAMTSANMLAAKGEIESYDDFRSMQGQLKRTPSLDKLKLKSLTAGKVPEFTPAYYQSSIGVGLSGKISQMVVLKYSLKPEDERQKGLLPTPYASDTEVHKQDNEALFGQDNLSFKLFGGAPELYDPMSGHATLMGGLKYKKDKTKKDSHFFEFNIFSFRPDGTLLLREEVSSEVPLALSKVFPIEGKKVAKDVTEVKYAVYTAYGESRNKLDHTDPNLRKWFIVDLSTGELLQEVTASFPNTSATPLLTRQLGDNRLAILYLYKGSGKGGLQEVILSPEGLVSSTEILEGSAAYDALKLPEAAFGTDVEWTQEGIISKQADGSILVLEQLLKLVRDETNQVTGKNNITYLLSKYDAEGKLVGMVNIGKLNKLDDMRVISLDAQQARFLIPTQTAEGRYQLSLKEIDFQNLTVTAHELPDEVFLAQPDAYYYDKESTMLYILTQPASAKGLNMHLFKW